MNRRLPEPLRDASRFLVGPTASGKSTVAMWLASRSKQPIEIIALDSMTLYRGFDIGTAKPTPAERQAVPHHMIDTLDPLAPYAVSQYVDDVTAVCEGIVDRGAIPLFVGGSGMFLRSLLRGLFDGPSSDQGIRERLEAFAEASGAKALHDRLAEVDPVLAGRIHPNDVRRAVRGLEVFELSGRPLSDWHNERALDSDAVRCVWLDGPRDWLHRRIDRRVIQMIDDGWIDEVRSLLSLDPPADSVFWTVLGYRELARHVRGETTREHAIERVQILTRQFAKRQITWFRNLDECRPLTFDAPATVESLAAIVSEELDIAI